MVATVTVQQITGTPGAKSYSEISSSTRLQTKDQFVPTDTTYPVPIPTSGFKYSYWVSICLDLAGTFTKINNVRFYSDGTVSWNFGTGGELRRGNRDASDVGCPDASYEQATGVEGDSGDPIETNHTYYSGQTTKTVDVESDTEGSPATVDSGDHTSAEKTKHVVLQVKVDTDAVQGEQTDETLSFKYDEI